MGLFSKQLNAADYVRAECSAEGCWLICRREDAGRVDEWRERHRDDHRGPVVVSPCPPKLLVGSDKPNRWTAEPCERLPQPWLDELASAGFFQYVKVALRTADPAHTPIASPIDRAGETQAAWARQAELLRMRKVEYERVEARKRDLGVAL